MMITDRVTFTEDYYKTQRRRVRYGVQGTIVGHSTTRPDHIVVQFDDKHYRVTYPIAVLKKI